MKSGFAKNCIDPPLGHPIVGYYHERLAKGVLDSLYVRAVAFEDGGKRALVVTMDLCLLPADYYAELRVAVAKTCHMDSEAVFINLSHTHTGPLIGKDFASGRDCDGAYVEFLTQAVCETAVCAFEDLRESEFRVAYGKAEKVSFVRRYQMKDGSVQTNPGPKNPNIDHALAESDPTVRLWEIVRKDGRNIYLVNFGTHADAVGGDYISADWPGTVCDTVERAIPNTDCVFLLAPQGDTNHINPYPTKGEEETYFIDFDNVPRGKEHSRAKGLCVAGAVLSVCAVAETVEAEGISYRSEFVSIPTHKENHRLEEAKQIMALYKAGRVHELPYEGMELTTVLAEAKRVVSLSDGPESYTYRFSCLKIGDVVLAGLAGEPFTEIGTRVVKVSPFAHTFPCCLTDSGAYFPTTKAYAEGGYEARGSTIAPGADDVIVENMRDILKEIELI